MAITRRAWEEAQGNPGMMDALLRFSMMENGQHRVDAWLNEMGLYGGEKSVLVAVVAIWDECGGEPIAHARVVINGKIAFDHEEAPYLSFPSDHFKTKVLLVTGGA